jgi:hypothetical protein
MEGITMANLENTIFRIIIHIELGLETSVTVFLESYNSQPVTHIQTVQDSGPKSSCLMDKEDCTYLFS